MLSGMAMRQIRPIPAPNLFAPRARRLVVEGQLIGLIADAVRAGLVDRRSDDAALVLLTSRGRAGRGRGFVRGIAPTACLQIARGVTLPRSASGGEFKDGRQGGERRKRTDAECIGGQSPAAEAAATPAEAMASVQPPLAELRIKPKG